MSDDIKEKRDYEVGSLSFFCSVFPLHITKTVSSPYLLRVYTLGLGMELVWTRYGEGMIRVRNCSVSLYFKLHKIFYKIDSLFNPQHGRVNAQMIGCRSSPRLVAIIVIIFRTFFISLIHHIFCFFFCNMM